MYILFNSFYTITSDLIILHKCLFVEFISSFILMRLLYSSSEKLPITILSDQLILEQGEKPIILFEDSLEFNIYFQEPNLN